MAGAEVTVSSGDLMMLKEEEGEASGSNHKTQVILHLQPILHGVNDGIADTGTTVLAIETYEDNKAEGEEIEYGYPITCGDSRAVLLFKKFVCPGINVRCVKFNDQLISPKQFVHLAGKATLKDWKRAIRLGGVMLRKMMDSGQIDFYQHDTVCSNTCRSTKFDVLINSTRIPPGTLVQPSPSCLPLDPLGGQVPPLTGEVVHDAAEIEEPLEEKFCPTSEWSPGRVRPQNPTTANGHAAKRKRADIPDGVLSLWQGVADSGLMGEVLSSLQTELLATLKGVETRSEKASLQETVQSTNIPKKQSQEKSRKHKEPRSELRAQTSAMTFPTLTDAVILNSLCKMFGLLDSVKQALSLKRCKDEENKVHHNVYVLDDILEDQRKQSLDKCPDYKIHSMKHVRQHRHNPPNSQAYNLLSAIKTSPGIQPLSLSGLSAASYTQLAMKPQIFTPSSATGRTQRGGCRSDRDGHNAMLKEDQELSKMGNKERLHRQEQEETSGIQKEPDQRTRRLHGEPHLKSVEEAEVRETEKVVEGGKVSKKHRSK